MAVKMEVNTSPIVSQVPKRAGCGFELLSKFSPCGRGASSKTTRASATEKCRMLMSKRFSMQAATKITRDTQMLRHCKFMPARIGDCAGERRFTRKAAETGTRSSRRNVNCDFKKKSTGK